MKGFILVGFSLFSFLCRIAASSDEVPTELTTRVGEFVVFDCEIDFPQNIIIPHVLQWRKDGELIFSWSDSAATCNDNFINRINLLSDTDAWQHGRGSINITSIRETDEGWFECKVIFPNRTPSSKPNGTWFHLSVEGGNLLAVPPVNETIMEGNPVTLKCVSKHPNSLVTWYKDNKVLNVGREFADRFQQSQEGSMNILTTEMKDSGYYSCEVANDVGEKQSAGAYLNVQFKAKVIYAPKRVYFPFGKSGHLECYYRANPDITKIRWEKDGFLFDAYNVPGVFSRKNGSLYFAKVDDSHAGEYSCTPYNDLGTNGPSPRMQVIVQKAPVFTLIPHVLYIRKVGETVIMPCDALEGEGIERPAISWHKKKGVIPQNRSTIIGGNLTIIDIQISDWGTFVCEATNEVSKITSEAELLVEDTAPTQAPYNVSVVDASTNSLTVRWLSGYERPKLNFSVWYRSNSTQDWKMIELNSNLYEAKIQDLSPGQTYDVMVLSQNDNGDGMFSKTIRVTTKSDNIEDDSIGEVDRTFRSPVGYYQQIGPPTDIYIQVISDGYRVFWKPPKHGQEMLKYYTVVWSREPSNEQIGAVQTVNTSFIINYLEEQKTYKIQILAMSTNDYEAASLKYLYCVPSFAIKKHILTGAVGGAFLTVMTMIALRYIPKCGGRS